MSGTRIEGGVTWGNVLSIATTIAVVAVSWGTMKQAQIEANKEIRRIEIAQTSADEAIRIAHEKQMTDIRADLVQQRRSIQAVEISDARNSERYEGLSRSMDEVKTLLRETNAQLRQQGTLPERR